MKTLMQCLPMEQYKERLLRFELLKESEVEEICNRAMDILILESNIRHVSSPVVVVGDVHGQFSDLQDLLKLEGPPGNYGYVFLGDYVDRGKNSLETILLLLVYKIMLPDKVTLIRGNHEQRNINKLYGFYQEIRLKYKTPRVWNMINDLFSYFNIGAIIDNRYLCVHGGISPNVCINKLQRVDRFEKLIDKCIFSEVIWSDPSLYPGIRPNPRGCGWLYGEDVLKQFLVFNNLEMVIRSHQLVSEGFKWEFKKICLTIWSAPEYMGKCTNPGAILVIEKDSEITDKCVKTFGKYARNPSTPRYKNL
jgi:serine/threonine-protein phosphatase 4 catalytic subunit